MVSYCTLEELFRMKSKIEHIVLFDFSESFFGLKKIKLHLLREGTERLLYGKGGGMDRSSNLLYV